MKKITLYLYNPKTYIVSPCITECKKVKEQIVKKGKRTVKIITASFFHPFLKKECNINFKEVVWQAF